MLRGYCLRQYPLQRVDKVIDTLADIEKQTRFCENKSVAVRWYGRVYLSKKHITLPFFAKMVALFMVIS